MSLTPNDLVCIKRNSELTIDATITGLDGTAADVSALSGDDIRWRIAATRGGTALATVSLTSNSYGVISKLDAANGAIRIQFQPPVPAADPDPFRAKRNPYWYECEVALTEVTTTQFFGPVQIQPSMFTAG